MGNSGKSGWEPGPVRTAWEKKAGPLEADKSNERGAHFQARPPAPVSLPWAAPSHNTPVKAHAGASVLRIGRKRGKGTRRPERAPVPGSGRSRTGIRAEAAKLQGRFEPRAADCQLRCPKKPPPNATPERPEKPGDTRWAHRCYSRSPLKDGQRVFPGAELHEMRPRRTIHRLRRTPPPAG
jgi:hypothetical protein